MAKKPKTSPGSIARNKRAKFEFMLEDKFEAGMVLTGWEVKALREGKCQITESYVFVKGGEAFISGMSVTPLQTISTHVVAEPTRVRKLLLHKTRNRQNHFGHASQGTNLCCTSPLLER